MRQVLSFDTLIESSAMICYDAAGSTVTSPLESYWAIETHLVHGHNDLRVQSPYVPDSYSGRLIDPGVDSSCMFRQYACSRADSASCGHW
jgi:hypothetical protein